MALAYIRSLASGMKAGTASADLKINMAEHSQEQPEVLYHMGNATELFLAIEEMEWRDAYDIIERDPQQVKTWVNNADQENANSSWRRLPLHEALLRRGPAWLINELISVFPGSPTLPTDLGEYPLHLAVDKACMPEVVNLIIVANWSAIVATDHLGRTPIDILDNQELLEIEENQVIFESLKRGLDTYTEIQRVHKEEKASLIRKQKAKSNAMSKLHQEELKREQAKQVKLELEIANYKAEIKNVREGQDETENKIQKHILSQNKCLDTIHELTEKETLQRQELEAQRAQIKALLFRVEQQDSEIQIKNHKIEVLSKDLKGIALANETFVKESLIETEQSMRTMVSNQIALQKLLTSRSNGLKTVLKHRGIALPDIRQLESLEDDQVEEEKSFEEDDLDDFSNHDVAASAAMMAAATAAIKAASTDEW